MRQVQRGATFHRHVHMRHRALQRQPRRESVHVFRKAGRARRVKKTQVVIAVRHLRCAAGVDAVDLRGHLVSRPQPGRAGPGHHLIAVVARKQRRVQHAQLLQRVPDPVIRPRFGKVVGPAAVRALRLDHVHERRAHRVHQRAIGIRTLQHQHPRAVCPHPHPFGLQRARQNTIGIRSLPQRGAVVHRHAQRDRCRVRVIRQQRLRAGNGSQIG